MLLHRISTKGQQTIYEKKRSLMGLQLRIRRGEGVTVLNITGGEAFLQPFHTLLGATMVE